jgi:type IX secretion system PorP/SprF family membrane protein
MLWIGIKGAPVIQSLSLSAPMKNDKVGLGIVAQFMQLGLTKSSSIYADYAYYIKLKTGTLSLGLKVGADRSNTDYTGILLNNSGDPVFSSNDKPYLLPNAGAGVYYFNDKLFAGISIPTFLSYRRTGAGSVQPYHSFREYDIVFSAGGLVPISQLLKFKPSMLMDYSFQETKKLTQLDLNGNLIISDLIWVGATWRVAPKGVAVGILQIQINPQLMFGFSYDFALGGINSFTKGSSEFVLRYDFGSKVSAANPRYF